MALSSRVSDLASFDLLLSVAALGRMGRAADHHGRPARQSAAEAVDSVLPQPFERTAVNGFGFLHIVRPRPRVSLLELAADRAAFEARALLRGAVFEGNGARRLAAHPTVIAILESKTDWTDALAQAVGGAVTLRPDASIPIHGGYAEKA